MIGGEPYTLGLFDTAGQLEFRINRHVQITTLYANRTILT